MQDSSFLFFQPKLNCLQLYFRNIHLRYRFLILNQYLKICNLQRISHLVLKGEFTPVYTILKTDKNIYSLHVLWWFKSLDLDLEWLQGLSGDDVLWQMVRKYPEGSWIEWIFIDYGTAEWDPVSSLVFLVTAPVWLNWGDSSMATKKSIRYIIVPFAMILLWRKLSHSCYRF